MMNEKGLCVSVTSEVSPSEWREVWPCRKSAALAPVDGLFEVLDTAGRGREDARYLPGRMGATGAKRLDGTVVVVGFHDDLGVRRRPAESEAILRAWRTHLPAPLIYTTQVGVSVAIIFEAPVTDRAIAVAAVEGARRLTYRFLCEADLDLKRVGARLRPGYVVDDKASDVGRPHYLPRTSVGGARWGGQICASRIVEPIGADRLAELALELPPVAALDSLIPTPKRRPLRDRVGAFFGRLTSGGH